MDKLANMDERLWILEDLNMMYIRQIALSLQVKLPAPDVRESAQSLLVSRVSAGNSKLLDRPVGDHYYNFKFDLVGVPCA